MNLGNVMSINNFSLDWNWTITLLLFMVNREWSIGFLNTVSFALSKNGCQNKTQGKDSNGKQSVCWAVMFFGVVILETLLLDFSHPIKWGFICTAFHGSKEMEQSGSTISVKGSNRELNRQAHPEVPGRAGASTFTLKCQKASSWSFWNCGVWRAFKAKLWFGGLFVWLYLFIF